MISRLKQYRYSKSKLQYIEVSRSRWSSLKDALRFILKSSVLAFVLFCISMAVGHSPLKYLQSRQIEQYEGLYAQMDLRFDSVQHILQEIHYADDHLYRNILELDSLPMAIRNAGTGGSDPWEAYRMSNQDNLIAKLLGKVDVLENQIQVQQGSYETIIREVLRYNRELKEVPAIQPVSPEGNIWISSYYGGRRDPFTLIRRSHKGIDFVGPRNTKIYATADGTVTLTKLSRRGYGNEVVITHGFGYSTRYAHLNKILVEDGAQVKRGQLIGLMGNTGRSTGTHLHYEVRLNNNAINPIYYYADDLTTEEYDLITKQAN